MIRDNYLDINKIIKERKILKLFRAVEAAGGMLRFVGGCVRDAIMGIEDFDLDMATDLEPNELVDACQDKGIRTVPIGIKFGTVGVLLDETILEVTSLRRDVSTDGRKAVVEFTDNWEIDASRRDLTINAVYADEKGTVFDYYDGLEDLEKGIVRFIGNPSERITEDYLRILRFFRFYSKFGKGDPDAEALKACVKNKDGLKKLSGERVYDEFKKIVMTKNALKALKIMSQHGILETILPPVKGWDALERMIALSEGRNIPGEARRRFYVLYIPGKENALLLANRLKMTKKARKSILEWSEIKPKLEEFLDDTLRLKLIYRYGKEFVANKFLIELAISGAKIKNVQEILDKTELSKIPELPVSGKDIIASGIRDNREIGAILQNIEERFIESDFSLSKENLLKRIVG